MNAAAALAAITAAAARPLLRADPATLSRALAEVEPVAGRLATREIGGIVVIDDTYNANPRSVRVALAAARETADGLRARLVVALGDMLELGALAPAMHAEAIRDLYHVHPDAAVAVGPEFAAALHSLITAGVMSSALIAPTPPPPVIERATASRQPPNSVTKLTGDGDALAVEDLPIIEVANNDALAVDGHSHRPIIHLAPDSTAAATIVRSLLRPGDVLLVKGSRGIAMERIIYGLAR
jgi:UDP-N-acetylmuramyl pentapeptide synthase